MSKQPPRYRSRPKIVDGDSISWAGHGTAKEEGHGGHGGKKGNHFPSRFLGFNVNLGGSDVIVACTHTHTHTHVTYIIYIHIYIIMY